MADKRLIKATKQEIKNVLGKGWTCSVCTKPAKLNCICNTAHYCSKDCQVIDWKTRGHKSACKKIRAGEAGHEEAKSDPESKEPPVFYGPAPRSYADDVRDRIRAEHEAALAQRTAKDEAGAEVKRHDSRCPICLVDFDINSEDVLRPCCWKTICFQCSVNIGRAPCPLCREPAPLTNEAEVAMIQRGVDKGIAAAMFHLGVAHVEGHLGVRKAPKKAVKLFERAIELGDTNAMTRLQKIYLDGPSGVKRNPKKAKELMQRAAEAGNVWGYHNFANLCRKEGNHELAFKYCKLAADAGIAASEYNMGVSYLKGEYAQVDHNEGMRWMKLAASHGDEGAIKLMSQLQQLAAGDLKLSRLDDCKLMSQISEAAKKHAATGANEPAEKTD